MSNKTGFEIRAELLGQAQGILEGNFHRKMDQYHAQVIRSQEQKDVSYPEYPGELFTTAQDVIAVAQQLSNFVNSK